MLILIDEIIHGKNDVELSKNLTRCGFDNNFVRLSK